MITPAQMCRGDIVSLLLRRMAQDAAGTLAGKFAVGNHRLAVVVHHDLGKALHLLGAAQNAITQSCLYNVCIYHIPCKRIVLVDTGQK